MKNAPWAPSSLWMWSTEASEGKGSIDRVVTGRNDLAALAYTVGSARHYM